MSKTSKREEYLRVEKINLGFLRDIRKILRSNFPEEYQMLSERSKHDAIDYINVVSFYYMSAKGSCIDSKGVVILGRITRCVVSGGFDSMFYDTFERLSNVAYCGGICKEERFTIEQVFTLYVIKGMSKKELVGSFTKSEKSITIGIVDACLRSALMLCRSYLLYSCICSPAEVLQ